MTKDLELKLNETVKYFKEQILAVRGARPTPKLVEGIQVDYFGQKLTIKQLGTISILPPREIQVSVWDKNAVPGVVKAIESSNLRVNANTNGNLIRINLPSLTQERRDELIKAIKKETEETRIKIRSQRDEINKRITKQNDDGEIDDDQKFRLKEEVQKIVDKANKEVEDILENKIREINE